MTIDIQNWVPEEQRCTSIDPYGYNKRCRQPDEHRGSCSAIPDKDDGKTEHRWWKD